MKQFIKISMSQTMNPDFRDAVLNKNRIIDAIDGLTQGQSILWLDDGTRRTVPYDLETLQALLNNDTTRVP